MAYGFNLIDDPWIPCIDLEGNPVELGIRDTLLHAHELREIHEGSPMNVFSMHRLLLVILHRVFGPPDTAAWKDLFDAGQWDATALNAYLDEWYDRFWLYHPDESVRRFYQWPVESESSTSPLHIVFSQGNTGTLFNHATDQTYRGASYAEIARLILSAHNFRLGGRATGISGYIKSGSSSNMALYMLLGSSLFETLLLNLVSYPDVLIFNSNKDDCPVWERGNPFDFEGVVSKDGVLPQGMLEYFTWQTLKLWLEPDEDGFVRVIRPDEGMPALHEDVLNPQAYYEKSKTGYKPKRIDEDRALWRDSYSLLNIDPRTQADMLPACLRWSARLVEDSAVHPRYQFQLAMLGTTLSKSGAGKLGLEVFDRMPLTMQYLSDEDLLTAVNDAIKWADDVGKELHDALWKMAQLIASPTVDQKDGRKPDKADVNKLVAHWDVMSDYWGQLEPAFYYLLDRLPGDEDAALDEWEVVLKRAAWSAFERAESMVGFEPDALRAAAAGRRKLGRSMKKVLNDEEGVEVNG